MKYRISFGLILALLLSACLAPATTTVPVTAVHTVTPTPNPPTETSSPSPLVIFVTETPEATPTPSASPTAQLSPTPVSPGGSAIIIDHSSIALFDQIPDEYIQAASQLSLLFQHASVGANISLGLDCMQNHFPGYPDPNRRPSACDRELNPGEVVLDPKYDRSKWVFEQRTSAYWREFVPNFVKRVDGLGAGENYQAVSFDYGYSLEPAFFELFFTNTDLNDNIPSAQDLEALEARHPDKTVIWWTTELPRVGTPELIGFNQSMREYALARGKVLMDIADIESHLPDGTPCTGIDNNQAPVDITAVCDEYVNEVFSGHLNSLGRLQGAKGIWVLMARLAGWKP